jgi:hypothetical protein
LIYALHLFLFKQFWQSSRWICFLCTATVSAGKRRASASKPVSAIEGCSVDMGTVVCLPTTENIGRVCGHAVDCFPSHYQCRAARSSPGEDLSSFTTQCEFLHIDTSNTLVNRFNVLCLLHGYRMLSRYGILFRLRLLAYRPAMQKSCHQNLL